MVRPVTPDPKHLLDVRPRGSALAQVGFDRDEGLIPYPNQSFPRLSPADRVLCLPEQVLLRRFARPGATGWRATPDKVEVDPGFWTGRRPRWNKGSISTRSSSAARRSSTCSTRPPSRSPSGLERSTSTGSSPTSHTRSVWKSIRSTTSGAPTRWPAPRPITSRFTLFRHSSDRSESRAFWYASREPWLREDDAGTEVYLNLVDLAFQPDLPADSTLVVWTTCTNLDLPAKLEHQASGCPLARHRRADCGRPLPGAVPTRLIRPPLRRGASLAARLAPLLNYLSLSDSDEGLARSRRSSDSTTSPTRTRVARPRPSIAS